MARLARYAERKLALRNVRLGVMRDATTRCAGAHRAAAVWSDVGRYSYCRAVRTSIRDARRAGRIAARTPASTATAVKAASGRSAMWNPTPWLDSARVT